MKKQHWIILLAALAAVLAVVLIVLLVGEPAQTQPPAPPETQTPQAQQTPPAQPEPEAQPPEPEEQPEPEEPPEPEPVSHVVVIDPGHQSHAESETEPNGPGSGEMKARVSGGTQSPFTGLPEYELTLQISLALEQELLARGYTVYLTRTENDVSRSNVERAQYASEVGGEILVRIHANGSTDASVQGAMTICQTQGNPYQDLYEPSRRLSDCILDAYCSASGIAQRDVWETDTMTGINWCQIPSTILEMGYMTNRDDDAHMADPALQPDMVRGIADGIDAYFAGAEQE